MKQIEKVLVIAHKFPPFEGIGARRWTKFVKYFSKKNVQVHVVTTNWNGTGKLSWKKDFENDNVTIHILNTPSLTLKNSFPSFANFIDSLTFKFRYKVFDLIDDGHFWIKTSKAKIERIIEKNKIDHVIATGAPFSINCFAIKLKDKFPQIKIIQDLRDPWLDSDYTLNSVKEKNRIYYKNLEKEMIDKSDAVVSVSDSLLKLFMEKTANPKIKSKTITNGFDPDDKLNLKENKQINFDTSAINISYFGKLGVGREMQLLKLANAIDSMPNSNEIQFKVNIFGETQGKAVNEIKKMKNASGKFNFYSYLPNDEIQYYMQKSDIHLTINAEAFPYAFGTKIFDAFLYAKPVLLIGPTGELPQLIVDNNLGYFTDGSLEMTQSVMNNMLNKHVGHKPDLNVDTIYSKFSIDSLSEEYLKFIGDL